MLDHAECDVVSLFEWWTTFQTLKFTISQFRSVLVEHHQTYHRGSYWFGVGSMPYLQWITSIDSMHIESKQCPQWVVLCWLGVGAMHIESVTMILNSYLTNILQHSVNYWITTCHTSVPNWRYFNNVIVTFIFIVTREVERDSLGRPRPPYAPRIAKPYIKISTHEAWTQVLLNPTHVLDHSHHIHTCTQYDH